jgi:hypothetical protein
MEMLMPRARIYATTAEKQRAYRQRKAEREIQCPPSLPAPRALTPQQEIDQFAQFVERAKVAARREQAMELLAQLVWLDAILDYMRRVLV